MLTHRNELLVRIPLTLWWHVFLKDFTLNLLIIVIYQSNGTVIILVPRCDTDTRLLTAHMVSSMWLSVIDLKVTITPIPIHE